MPDEITVQVFIPIPAQSPKPEPVLAQSNKVLPAAV
jgi:hypothetical protein